MRDSPPATGAKTVRLTDFEQAASFFSDWQGRFEQLTCGRFEGHLRVVRGVAVRAVAVAANQSVLLRGRDAADLYSFHLVTPTNQESTWQGRHLAPGQLVVLGPDTEADHRTARKLESQGLSVSPDELGRVVRSVLRSEVTVLTHTWRTFSPAPNEADGFKALLTQYLEMGTADPTFPGTPEGRRLEQGCVRSLVACLAPVQASSHLPTLPERSRLVRRAEEFFRSRLDGVVGAIDLCEELGVSGRTLRLAFHERFGIGPMAYYRCLRLNAVRSRLRSDPHAAIADAARVYGFYHLGNFAADYRRLFGERPSDTVRRSAGRF